MKILKLSPYYYPEQISSSHLDKDLTDAMIKEDFYIENFVPTPSRNVSEELIEKYSKIKYEELENGHIIIHRFSMFREGKNVLQRAIRYILVNIIQYFKGINAKGIDLIYAGSTPPTQGLLCALVKKSLKVPFVYNLQDIFPDSLVNAKMTKEGSLIWKIGRLVEDFTYRNADKIIVISNGFKRNLMAKGVPERKILVISNWIDTDSIKPIARAKNQLIEEYNINPDKFIVVYAGNFGASQGASIILHVAELLQKEINIQFVIFGGGTEFEQAVEYVSNRDLKNIIINKLLPQERVSEVYSLGDVALITCKKGVGNAGLPSKTWSIMACNTPIIASFDLDSDLASLLNESKAGCCVEPENIEALVNEIKKVYLEWKHNRSNDCEIRNYAVKYASKQSCVSEYIKVIKNTNKFEG